MCIENGCRHEIICWSHNNIIIFVQNTFMRNHRFLFVLPLILLLGSCGIGSERMFNAPKDYAYDSLPSNDSITYVISPNDRLDLEMFTNDGFRIIDIASANETMNIGQGKFQLTYLVETDSTCNFPIIGRIKVGGFTLRECEDTLLKLYNRYYVDPLVQIKVVNRRVMVYTGGGGKGTVVPLSNEYMTLIEVLTEAKGITSTGKAKAIKVIRANKNSETGFDVFQINLKTIEGIEQANMRMKANDLVYVTPVFNPINEGIQQVLPAVTLASSTLAIVISVIALSAQ
jgi:polysaccharide export outer membrane protein